MKLTKLLAISTALFATTAIADESEQIILKLRANLSSFNAKQSDLPPPNPGSFGNAIANGKLFALAYGAEGSATMFLTNYFAGEFGTGFSLYKAKGTALASVINNYPTGNVVPYNKKRNMYVVPSYATLQYHIAPFGALRPYVGAGYHYTYIIPRSKEYKLKNGSGVVFQAGADLVLKDDTYINLDVKYFSLKTTAKYNKSYAVDANNNQVVSKMKLNPLVIGFGLGFKL